MPHCMVPECCNHSRVRKGEVSYHRLPANEKLSKTWLDLIPRKNPRPSSYSYVCSDHFCSDCFEVSYMQELTGHKQNRRLKPGSIPTIFPRSSLKKTRPASEGRRCKRQKQEMMTSLLSIENSNNDRVEHDVNNDFSTEDDIASEPVCEDIADPDPDPLENSNSCVTEAMNDSGNSVGVQCNIGVRCLVSVAVQTDPTSIPLMVDQGGQADEHIPQDGIQPPLDPQVSEQPIFLSPCKSTASSTTMTEFSETSDNEFQCDESSDDSECEEPSDYASKVVHEKKFIVFESQLDELFTVCPQCCAPISELDKTTMGTLVTVKYSCINGHDCVGNSQPFINQTPAGNVLASAAILFSGNTFSKINEFFSFLSLQFISQTKYYEYQRQDLWPIVNKKWCTEQDKIIGNLQEENYVDLCGDGRCDSPGHNAKFGTYTLMEELTGQIVNFQIVQVNETTSSNAMEAEGCKRGLDYLLDKDVPIRCLSTDRHITITSNMKKFYPAIEHQYDTWHLAKWVVKKLTAKAKQKNCENLFAWIHSISNHLWWSVATCDGRYVLLKEKWISIIHHVANKHSWGGCEAFKTCAHHKLTREEQQAIPWLKIGSAAHTAMKEVVMNKKLLKDLQLLTGFHHTGELEVYHSLMLKYVPKRQQFSYEGMVARTQLAALDHNFNIGRNQATVSTGPQAGAERYKVVFPKGRKTWVAKPVYQKKSHDYIFDMMSELVNLRLKRERALKAPLPSDFCRSIAPEGRPEKNAIVEKLTSRFNKK